MLLSLRCALLASAQQSNNKAAADTDLTVENQSRVAASTDVLKKILQTDAGLMVELKHWVAKDASDHGQILNDSDLTDDAIFTRLDDDIQFRSIATALVQRYGYLLPKLNPDSDLAKQNELLIQERTRWLAQDQEEQLVEARQRGRQSPQSNANCDPQTDKDCSVSKTRTSAPGTLGPAPQPETLPLGNVPPSQNSPTQPGWDANSLLRARLTQPGEDAGSLSSSLALPVTYDSASSFSAQNVSSMESSGSQSARLDGAGGTSLSGGNSNAGQGGGDGLLSGYGLGANAANEPMNGPGDTAGLGSSSSPFAQGPSTYSPMNPDVRRSSHPSPLQLPEMMRTRSPYENIPSLYDMYVQAVPRPAAPSRFGAEVFANGTHDPQLIPIDFPASPDYVVGPGDGLTIDLWGGVSQRLFRTVDHEGRIALPEIGPMLVNGQTLGDVQQSVQRLLRTQFRDVSADVSLSRLRTVRVYVVGDVNHPGPYDVSSLSTPLNALLAAGGPTADGSMRIVKHYRGDTLVQQVDLYDLLLRGVRTDLKRLEPGDTLLVPPVALWFRWTVWCGVQRSMSFVVI